MSGMLRGRISVTLGAVVALLLATAGPASGDTVTVANTNDAGPGSLRQLMDDAFPGDTIIVPAGRYELSTGSLFFDLPITVRGAGARRTIIDANGGGPAFFVTASSEATIADLTITGGFSAQPGGGIRADTDLVLDGVALVGNRADLTPDMDGYEDGGGVATDFNSGTSLTIRDSLVAGNTGYNGGGIHSGGPLTIINSTIAGNTAGSKDANGYGGGFYADSGGDVTIVNSTIAGNRDFSAENLEDGGGGVVIDPSLPVQWTVRNTILAGNMSFEPNGDEPGSPTNPAVANNCNDDADPPTEVYNLDSLDDCQFASANSLRSADAALGQLADNGGETDTLALLAGSDAIGRGFGCEPADQRGLSRSLSAPCDLGAYERVLCGGVAVNRFGTPGKDTVVGTTKADGILGLGGNDLLKGLAGKDGLCGGKGRDRLLGGKGRDRLLGGKGRDRLRGGPGRDVLRGGPGRDRQRQ